MGQDREEVFGGKQALGRLGGGAVIHEVGWEGSVGRTADLFVVCDLRKGLHTEELQVTVIESEAWLTKESGLGAGGWEVSVGDSPRLVLPFGL